MSERRSVQNDSRGKYRILSGWASLVGVAAFVVWLAIDPFELTWNQVFGGAVVLSAAGAIASLLLRRWGWARSWAGRIPPPGHLATGLVSRPGVPLPLLEGFRRGFAEPQSERLIQLLRQSSGTGI